MTDVVAKVAQFSCGPLIPPGVDPAVGPAGGLFPLGLRRQVEFLAGFPAEELKDYLEHLSAMARSFGLQARCKYGQGFCTAEPITVNDIMALTVEEN